MSEEASLLQTAERLAELAHNLHYYGPTEPDIMRDLGATARAFKRHLLNLDEQRQLLAQALAELEALR